MSIYRDQLNDYLKGLHVQGDVIFEIGAGTEEERIKAKAGSFVSSKYFTIDVDGNTAPDYVFDINEPLPPEIGENPEKLKNQADLIFCFEVFEYVWNPIMALENICAMMKKEGAAYISFPTNYPLHNPVDIDYLRYTKKWIEKTTQVTGLKVDSIIPRVVTRGKQSLADFWKQEGMHVAKTSDIFDMGYIAILTKI